MMGALSAAGPAIGSMIGDLLTPNNRKAYNEYSQNLMNLSGTYNPWAKLGFNAFKTGTNLATQNTLNPAMLQNTLAQSFQMSPYQSNLENKTMDQMNVNAANTGMVGSQSANNTLASQLNRMTGQFENQYIDRGLNQYNQGLNSLLTHSAPMGFNALNNQNRLAQTGYQAQLQGHLANNAWWGNVANAVGQGAGSAIGSFA